MEQTISLQREVLSGGKTMAMNRRELLAGIGAVGSGLVVSGASAVGVTATAEKPNSEEQKGMEVSAVEDLMREHGVLRRVLVVYSEAANRLRGNPSSSLAEPLQKAAKLYVSFGAQYHAKQLEEGHVFPAVKRAGGDAAGLVDLLIVQHNRATEITEYITAATKGSQLEAGMAEPLAQALDSFVRMYRAHASREDTIIFPAWKKTLTTGQYDQMGDKFEGLEHQMFGEDGFEKAVQQVEDIEGSLNLTDLAQFTAPAPPAK
jgi:hemerythrin-like domain-containing protein